MCCRGLQSLVVWGMADIALGFRYRLSQRLWVVSLQGGAKIPSAYETDETSLNLAPPLGDGQTDFDFLVLLGRSVFDHTGYVNLEIGYRARSGEPLDELLFRLEGGINLSKDYLLIGQLFGVKSLSEQEGQMTFRIVDGQLVNFVGTGAIEDFVRAQLQLEYRINDATGLTFEFGQVLTGRNTASGTTIGFGVTLSN